MGVPADNDVRLAAAVLCGLVLAGCDSIRDVAEEPYIEPGAQNVVLQGTLQGVSSQRPVVLQYNGTDTCTDTAGAPAPCRFFGTVGQQVSTFSFGSLPAGTRYDIKVKTPPYGKLCRVDNATGTLGTATAAPAVTCVNDPAVPRYSVTVNVAPAVAAIAGVKVILTTEEGVQERPATGQTSITFADAIFNSEGSLPIFKWFVTATSTAGNTVNNCNVTAGSNEAFNSEGQDVSTPPSGPVGNVQVTLCSFTVNATVAYQAAAGQPTLTMPAGGMELGLKRARTGNVEQTVALNSFATAAFTEVLSNRDAIYELAITRQPAGMTCVVGSSSQYQWGSAVLLLNTLDAARSPSHGWITNRNVRCRANPLPAAQLQGSYRVATVAASGAATATRNFLTFFADGTYLHGHHATGTACSTTCGVEHGFYVFDAGASSIAFNPTTDTNGASGLSAISGGAAVATPLTAVVRTPAPGATIQANLGAARWLLTEPASVDGQMAGAWVTADHRRVWVFDAGTYNGFHAGVNGLGNAQDGCYNIEDPAAPAGFYTRRGNATTCDLGSGYFTLDVPNANTVPRVPDGFIGKWPQSTSNSDGRPSSPVNYLITPGAPDVLRIRETSNGLESLDGVTPISPEILLFRARAN